MSGTRWYQERRRDGFYKRAKKEGYRARSAYKLLQIQDKFHIIKPGDAVADLGCAPGSWSQVLVELVEGGVVVGVDLQRTRPVEGADFIRGDFTHTTTQQKLAELLATTGRTELDAVASDMAPDMSGNYGLDQVRSVHLCRMAMEFADQHVREGGSFVCKVFEGADFMEFREELRSRYKRVFQVNPQASRKISSEVYLVGRGKHKPPVPASEPEPEPPKVPRGRVQPRHKG